METILSYGGGMLGDFGVVLRGGSGWLQSAMRIIALQLAATVLLAAIGWATSPLFVIGTVASAVALGVVNRRNTMERNLKEKMAETARAELHKLPAKALPNMLHEVHKTFDAFQSSVERGIDVMIANVRDTIDSALADRRAKEGEQAPELERLDWDCRGPGPPGGTHGGQQGSIRRLAFVYLVKDIADRRDILADLQILVPNLLGDLLDPMDDRTMVAPAQVIADPRGGTTGFLAQEIHNHLPGQRDGTLREGPSMSFRSTR